MRALVVGSSGYVGSRLVAELARAGVDVTATARNLDKLRHFGFPPEVRLTELDVSDELSCRRAFDRAGPVDVAYYLVHSIGGDDFAERDRQAADNFAAAAAHSGVGRIVYLGGFVPRGEELSEHLESRADVGDVLVDSTDNHGGDVVWLRAAVILGAGSTSFEVVRYMAERLPVVPLPGFMNATVSPIAVDDVLYYLVAAADRELLPAGSYDISNHDDLTYTELIKLYARTNRLRRVWLPIPWVSPRIAAPAVAALTPIPKDLVADLVMSLVNTMSTTDDRIRRHIPDPADGLTTTEDSFTRAAPSTQRPVTVCDTSDPLQLTSTDPGWAGGR